MGKIKKGVVVFATQDTSAGRSDARLWLNNCGLTPGDVRLYKHDGMVLVESLREISITTTQRDAGGGQSPDAQTAIAGTRPAAERA